MIAYLFMKSDVKGNIGFVSFGFFLPENHRYRWHAYCHLLSMIKNPRLEVHKEFLKFAVLNSLTSSIKCLQNLSNQE